MEQNQTMWKEKALQYTKEAFANHREEIFQAMDIIYDCAWIARRNGLLDLEEKTEEWAKGEGEEPPLKEFLIPAMQALVDAMDPDRWEADAYGQALEKEYSGYEWYISYVYLTGMRNILAGTIPQHIFLRYRVMIPENWLSDYDAYERKLYQEEEGETLARTKELVQKGFVRRTSIRGAFHKRFVEMEPEDLRWVLGELDDRTLAEGIFLAEEDLRDRLLEYMTERQQERILEAWSTYADYDYTIEKMYGAMDRMLIVAGLNGNQ